MTHPRTAETTSVLRSLTAAGALALGAGGVTAVDAQTAQNVHRSQHHAFAVDTVVHGLDQPWGIAFLPGGETAGDVLVTERSGRLRIVRLDEGSSAGDGAGVVADLSGRLDPTPVSGVPEVLARGQGGLMDVALHPDFVSNRLVYLSYSKPGESSQSTTAVIRGRLGDHALEDVEEVVEAAAWRQGGAHFGSRLAFDADGYLYVTVGERRQSSAAQDRSNHQGVTLRLHADGSVPDDNPFVGESGVRPEIWTYGNRNPQGLDVHPETGELWQTEHGPRGGDELNRLRAGANYGWPAITHGIDYDGSMITEDTARAGMEQPVHYWVPSIATSGLEIYDGDAFPDWQGDAFVGGLRGTVLARVDLQDPRGDEVGGWERLLDGYARIRQVRQAPDGTLWLLLDQNPSPLVRLVPAG
jgi:glucose/arabinose dehydrogenase